MSYCLSHYKYLLILLLAIPFFAEGQGTINSVQDGEWRVNSTWDANAPACKVKSDVVITDTVTSTCSPLEIGGKASITIKNGGHLIVESDAGLTGNGDLTVESDGSLEVQGDLDISGKGDFTLDGKATVDGNLNVGGNGTADGSGTLNLGGDGCNEWTGSGPCNGTLPVELIFFDAEPAGDRVQLEWRTASEQSNDHFTIERSTDGKNFEAIGKVNGAGTRTVPKSYKYSDEEAQTGLSYYRLKQTDTDGRFEVSDPVAVRYAGNEDSIKVYPNPTSSNEGLNLELKGLKGEVLVVLRDIHGKEHHTKVIPTSRSESTMTVMDIKGSIPSGIYFAIASSNDQMYRKRVVIE